ncbi:MAG: hypothetical protein QGM50_09815, partial [Anaerolineae bacterium]|nr:hypothetical protein [Anaerolineae bacterium]
NIKTAQILATAFAKGSMHDFQLFKTSRIGILAYRPKVITPPLGTRYPGLLKLKLYHASNFPENLEYSIFIGI